MLSTREDDVSNIHRRWSFTRLTPTSLKSSYAMTLTCAFVVVTVSHVFHLGSDITTLAVHLPAGLGAIVGLTLLDGLLLRGTPVNKLTKVVHVSSFATLLWAITVLAGMLADAMFAKNSTDYLVAGMMLAAGLRIGIFTSVFGANLGRAVAICMVMPLIFFLTFVPSQSWEIMTSPVGLGFGIVFVVLAIAWVAVADRAGRPHVPSTFRLLQAFISSWTDNRSGGIEEMFEAKAHEEIVSTSVLKFVSKSGEIVVVLPDIHPGPFAQAGGSNLPYVLFDRFGGRALVMHGVSGHSLNLPSKRQVERYVSGLDGLVGKEYGKTASQPVQLTYGNATATAIAFGKTVLLMLSLAPKGMEDVPQKVRTQLESHAGNLGFRLLVSDCHNAMGGLLDERDYLNLVAAAEECLNRLRDSPQYEFRAGFASLGDVSHTLEKAPELGQSGIAVTVLEIGDSSYGIGWADANNMENNLRDRIISRVNQVKLLDVCTSDTHATSGKRTREGYFALGTVSSQERIVTAYSEMFTVALERLQPCSFETSVASSKIKVMGKKQFEEYSSALDRSMNITKAFVAVTFAAFISMQVLAS